MLRATAWAWWACHAGDGPWPPEAIPLLVNCQTRSGVPPPCSLPFVSAVIAISSIDRKTGCFSFWDDCFDVADIVEGWRKDWG